MFTEFFSPVVADFLFNVMNISAGIITIFGTKVGIEFFVKRTLAPVQQSGSDRELKLR